MDNTTLNLMLVAFIGGLLTAMSILSRGRGPFG